MEDAIFIRAREVDLILQKNMRDALGEFPHVMEVLEAAKSARQIRRLWNAVDCISSLEAQYIKK